MADNGRVSRREAGSILESRWQNEEMLIDNSLHQIDPFARDVSDKMAAHPH